MRIVLRAVLAASCLFAFHVSPARGQAAGKVSLSGEIGQSGQSYYQSWYGGGFFGTLGKVGLGLHPDELFSVSLQGGFNVTRADEDTGLVEDVALYEVETRADARVFRREHLRLSLVAALGIHSSENIVVNYSINNVRRVDFYWLHSPYATLSLQPEFLVYGSLGVYTQLGFRWSHTGDTRDSDGNGETRRQETSHHQFSTTQTLLGLRFYF